jgi:chorismate mutase/prephenate dehydratase
VTRFLVIGRGPSPWAEPADDPAQDRTSVLLILGDRPGDLFEALRPIAEANVNLTRIESRPSRRRPWEYVFFLDVEGHRAEARVSEALALLANGRTLRVLGSYRKADEAT